MTNFSQEQFIKLITAASLAPSADNMQPWEFKKNETGIEVFFAKHRALPEDVIDMFSYISIGAAIQNIVIEAKRIGLKSFVEYYPENNSNNVAFIRFEEQIPDTNLAKFIIDRNTNRCPFIPFEITNSIIEELNNDLNEFDSGIYWLFDKISFEKIAFLDANSSYIRLEHKPLHDELFSILRFTKKENEKFRFGLTFESLEVPKFAVLFARMLKYNSVNNFVSKLGFGKLVAKQLSNKLTKTSTLCLLTAKEQSKTGYIKTGRALEQLWIKATKEGLSVQPYGVLPQYFTKTDIEPEKFLPKYISKIENHKKTFYEIFKESTNEFPAILLRIGKANKQSARSTIRLNLNQIIK